MTVPIIGSKSADEDNSGRWGLFFAQGRWLIAHVVSNPIDALGIMESDEAFLLHETMQVVFDQANAPRGMLTDYQCVPIAMLGQKARTRFTPSISIFVKDMAFEDARHMMDRVRKARETQQLIRSKQTGITVEKNVPPLPNRH